MPNNQSPVAYTGRVHASTKRLGDCQFSDADFSVTDTGVVSLGGSTNVGQVTLVLGTSTIADTTLGANDRIFLTRADENSSTALGELTITAQTAGTSFVITSLDASDGSTTITADVSKVNYFIIRQS